MNNYMQKNLFIQKNIIRFKRIFLQKNHKALSLIDYILKNIPKN